jgi:hypothetical protein
MAKMRYRKANPPTGVPSGTVGAIGELLVAADLMRKGYAVFRSMSPACPCDIAILKDGVLSRVEVTTGKKLPSGKIMYPPHKTHTYDILAIVLYDHGAPAIVYEPEL